MSTLEITQLSTGYVKAPVLRDVNITVADEIVAVLGANGAGKTTLLRAISGNLKTWSGSIAVDGTNLKHTSSWSRARRGVAHVPEGRQLFPTMTVLENLELGARTPAARAARAATLATILGLFPRLAERRRQLAGSLSGGEQQMCAIGRALMARPRLLMLDEPSLGLAPVIVGAIFDNLARINREGTTVLLVEQNVLRALGLSHRAYVLENGTIALEGPRERLLADEGIKRAYLGR